MKDIVKDWTFGQWLVVGLCLAFFLMGVIGVMFTHDSDTLKQCGSGMLVVALGYAIGTS